MLCSKNRLRNKKDINNVSKRGTTAAGNFILLKFIKNNLNNSRFAFVISSRIFKSAVKRNKIKRRLREITKKNIFRIKNAMDFLIIVKGAFIRERSVDLEKELLALFNKSKLLIK